jgi:hypothetical protein
MRIIVVVSIISAYAVWKLAETPALWSYTPVAGNPLGVEASDNQIFGLTLALGELFVFLFYWFKFNEWAGDGDCPAGFRPRPVRHFTTWLRYLGWNCTYGLIMVAAFSIIVFFPDLIERIIKLYTQSSQVAGLPANDAVLSVQSFLESRAAPSIHDPLRLEDVVPFGVVLVTVVWSGIKPFAEFERRFRLQLQERAAVPSQARDLIETFATDDSTFEHDPDFSDQVVEKSGGRIAPEDFDSKQKSGRTIRTQYARVEYLNYLLQQYKRKPVFSHLTERYLSEFQDLELGMVRLRELVSRRINDVLNAAVEEKLLDSSKQAVSIGRAEELIEELDEVRKSKLRTKYFDSQAEELEKEIEVKWREILRLIVCSVLAVGKSTTYRHDLFAEFGLTMKGRIPIQLKWQTLTIVAAGTLFTVFLCSAAYFFVSKDLDGSPAPLPADLNTVLFWSVSACIMHLLGIGAGYTVQQSLETQRKRMQLGKDRLPMRSDLFAEAAWAAAFGISLNVFYLALLLILKGSFTALVNVWWWACIPGVTAFFAAVYTQQDNRYRLFGRGLEKNKARRDKQILISQVVITGMVAILVASALNHERFNPIDEKMLAFLVYSGITTSLIGLALALILREWVRAEQRHGGEIDRRGNRRQYESEAQWQDAGQTLEVRTCTISDNGAEITATAGLEVGGEGKIRILPDAPRLARIIRQDEKDTNRYYIGFLQGAA